MSKILFRFWLNPIQDGFFRCCLRMGGGRGKKAPSRKSVTHILQWWNLAQLYLTKRRSKKLYDHVTHPLSSADKNIFSPQISKFCYIKKYRYRLHFDTQFIFILSFLEYLKFVITNMVKIDVSKNGYPRPSWNKGSLK